MLLCSKIMLRNILIVGLGTIGKRYFNNLSTFFKDREVFIYKKLKNKSEKNFKTKKIGAAIISNPSNLHIHSAIKFAKKGIHCLIEKPLSINFKGVTKLVKIKKKKNLSIQVGYNLRFLKGAQFFKKKFQNKKKQIKHITINCLTNMLNWRKDKNYKKFSSSSKKLNGGVLFELSHEVDYLRWIFGDIKEVFAIIKNTGKLKSDIDEIARILIKLKSGITADINLSLINHYEKRDCIVFTKQGYYEWNLLKDEVKKNNKSIFKNKKFDINQTQIDQIKNFLNSISKNSRSAANLEDGIKTLKTLLAIEKSSKSKKIITL
ncbi:hypothetical protein CBE37_01505 [bacterium TMED277]|nr:hypothetical protein [Candidatus Pelagibacter sp.]OUX44221.1 MAG: hypothetical protein CBE37_01505 [bacterium TMED277]